MRGPDAPGAAPGMTGSGLSASLELVVTPLLHHQRMDSYAIKRHLDDVESYLRKARRKCERGSEVERYIKKALSSLEDAQRQMR